LVFPVPTSLEKEVDWDIIIVPSENWAMGLLELETEPGIEYEIDMVTKIYQFQTR